MKKSLGLLAALAVIWWLWSGHTEVLIVSFGVGSCLLVCFLANRMQLVDAEGLQIHLLPGLMRYWFWLTLEILKANIEVAERILTNRIRPTIRKIPSGQNTDMGRVIYANSITLTPGTLSYELDSDHIHVHALHIHSFTDLMTGDMRDRVKKLENQG